MNCFLQYQYFIYRYGLQEFIVITPADRNKAIDSESRAKVLLSSVSIALTNASRYWKIRFSQSVHYPASEPTSLGSYFVMLHAKLRSSKYHFHSLWFDLTAAWTHNLSNKWTIDAILHNTTNVWKKYTVKPVLRGHLWKREKVAL